MALPLLASLLALPAFATPTNRTIDDETGDSATGALPVYSPASAWSQGATCGILCGADSWVDPTDANGGTWHDSTYYAGDTPSAVSVKFTGTAVYVYNIMLNVPDIEEFFFDYPTNTYLTFELDGARVDKYVHVSDESSDVSYDVLVYMNDSLDAAEHTLTMSAGGAYDSLILFDYVVYTFDDGVTSSAVGTSSQTYSLTQSSSSSQYPPQSTSSTATSAPFSATTSHSTTATSPLFPSTSDPSTQHTTPTTSQNPPPASASPDQSTSTQSLSPGAVAGIAVVCVLAALFALALAYHFLWLPRVRPRTRPHPLDAGLGCIRIRPRASSPARSINSATHLRPFDLPARVPPPAPRSAVAFGGDEKWNWAALTGGGGGGAGAGAGGASPRLRPTSRARASLSALPSPRGPPSTTCATAGVFGASVHEHARLFSPGAAGRAGMGVGVGVGGDVATGAAGAEDAPGRAREGTVPFLARAPKAPADADAVLQEVQEYRKAARERTRRAQASPLPPPPPPPPLGPRGPQEVRPASGARRGSVRASLERRSGDGAVGLAV